ncbi:hypothetical protein HWV62_28932 [Athelia sp. TMB]|nr:hypothetical protein HWV62_28932 [Athelia sp. TMB]
MSSQAMPRLRLRDSFWDNKKKPFAIAVGSTILLLILLFLGNLSYLYGSLYKSGDRIHNINVLAVDFDGGVIGQSLSAVYKELQSDQFPTLQFHSTAEYPTVDDVRNAVCRGEFWAGVVTQPGASSRLSAALGGGSAASEYNPSNTLTYVWNEANYPAVQLGNVAGNLQTLIGATSAAYHAINGTQAITALNASSPAAVSAFSDPIRASSISIAGEPQGTRVLYNTITMILPILQQFFFLMALNGINNQFHMYARLATIHIIRMRFSISATFTLLSSLTIAGYIWAFRESWAVSGRQFALVWMTFWLYCHINFLVLDVATAFIPASFLTFFVITWAVMNVTATIYPFALVPGFYKWAYALPSHETWAILVQIYSNGCNNQLHRALPILFSWWIVGLVLAVFGVLYRDRAAKRGLMAAEERERELIAQGKNMGLERELAADIQAANGPVGWGSPIADNIYREPALSRETTEV